MNPPVWSPPPPTPGDPSGLDRRLHAARPDLADRRLEGRVAAGRFVAGVPRRVIAATAPLKRAPRADAGTETEALRGEGIEVFEETVEGWAWVRLDLDAYVGWMPTEAIGSPAAEPTHRVSALRAFVFPGPDLKLPPAGFLSFASRLALADEALTRGTSYRRLADGAGWVAAAVVETAEAPPAGDFVAVAERFIGVPYLWGGRSSLGLDCSGLIQLALAAAGIAAPRDTDMQEAALGRPLVEGTALRRGDLVFWKGHVGVLADPTTLLHANGHHMQVAAEPFASAVARIAAAGLPVTSIRRF